MRTFRLPFFVFSALLASFQLCAAQSAEQKSAKVTTCKEALDRLHAEVQKKKPDYTTPALMFAQFIVKNRNAKNLKAVGQAKSCLYWILRQIKDQERILLIHKLKEIENEADAPDLFSLTDSVMLSKPHSWNPPAIPMIEFNEEEITDSVKQDAKPGISRTTEEENIEKPVGRQNKAKDDNKPPTKRKADRFRPLYYIYGVEASTDFLVRIDPRTGVAERIGPLGLNIFTSGLSFGPGGKLYGFSTRLAERESMEKGLTPDTNRMAEGRSFCLYEINKDSGKATPIMEAKFKDIAFTIGFEYADDSAPYWIAGNRLVRIDTQKKRVDEVIQLSQGGSFSLTLYEDGRLLALTHKKQLALLDIEKKTVEYKPILGHPGRCCSIAYGPDGRIYIMNFNQTYYCMDDIDSPVKEVGKIGCTLYGLATRRIHADREKHKRQHKRDCCTNRSDLN